MAALQIVGAGGLGCEVYQYAHGVDPGREMVFLDDSVGPRAAAHLPRVTIRPLCAFDPGAPCIVAVGEPADRARLSDLLAGRGATFASVVHPSACIAVDAVVHPGCVVAPFAFISTGSIVEHHALIGPYALVGHDARVGRCAVLSNYAALTGGAVLGDRGFVGTHATLTPRSVVGAQSKVAAGAVVYGKVPARVLALGNPARWREEPPQGERNVAATA